MTLIPVKTRINLTKSRPLSISFGTGASEAHSGLAAPRTPRSPPPARGSMCHSCEAPARAPAPRRRGGAVWRRGSAQPPGLWGGLLLPLGESTRDEGDHPT